MVVGVRWWVWLVCGGWYVVVGSGKRSSKKSDRQEDCVQPAKLHGIDREEMVTLAAKGSFVSVAVGERERTRVALVTRETLEARHEQRLITAVRKKQVKRWAVTCSRQQLVGSGW